MAETEYVKNVALVGANGNLGKHFLKSLLESNALSITVLTRAESRATLTSAVKVARVEYSSQPSLVAALHGIEFLVITLPAGTAQDVHSNLVRAAETAGVHYVMPNAYGYDAFNSSLANSTMYGAPYIAKCDEIKDLGMKYIALCCGFWYEWSLAAGEQWFGFSIKDRKVTFFDDGTTKINTSTMAQCGEALRGLLSLPKKSEEGGLSISIWENRPLYISSFLVSQRDMLDSLHRVLGTTDSDWQISYEPTDKRHSDGLEGLKRGESWAHAKAMYSRVFFPNGDGNHESRSGLANKDLGIPSESLDRVTESVVNMIEGGWSVEKALGM